MWIPDSRLFPLRVSLPPSHLNHPATAHFISLTSYNCPLPTEVPVAGASTSRSLTYIHIDIHFHEPFSPTSDSPGLPHQPPIASLLRCWSLTSTTPTHRRSTTANHNCATDAIPSVLYLVAAAIVGFTSPTNGGIEPVTTTWQTKHQHGTPRSLSANPILQIRRGTFWGNL